jgi:hypothetical protein
MQDLFTYKTVKIIFKCILKDMDLEGMDWIHVDHDRDYWQNIREFANKLSNSINYTEFPG